MSDNSEDDTNDVEWIFYRDRPEWSDIKPIPQDDGANPIVQIAYTDKFRDIYDYVRAILASREISERAFKLFEDAVIENPANYTVWHYRRILLKELNKDLNEELKFSQRLIEETPKNYQVWYHRKVIVEWLNDPSYEKHLTALVLANDAKNYHAWQHRQWLIQEYDLWDDELEFIDKLIEQDVRNNSAWNQRYFVISQHLGKSDEVIEQEIKYTLAAILKAPNNESPWNYLRGIIQDKEFNQYQHVIEFVENLYNSGCRSPHLLGFIIDCLEENLLSGGDPALCKRALELCEILANKHDTIRKEYWNFIARNLGNLYGSEEAHVRESNPS